MSTKIRLMVVKFIYDYVKPNSKETIRGDLPKQYDADRNRKKIGNFSTIRFSLC